MPARVRLSLRRKRHHEEVQALAVLSSYEGQWFSAVEVPERLSSAWRPLAFALRRLVERGIADETVVVIPYFTVFGKQQSARTRRLEKIFIICMRYARRISSLLGLPIR